MGASFGEGGFIGGRGAVGAGPASWGAGMGGTAVCPGGLVGTVALEFVGRGGAIGGCAVSLGGGIGAAIGGGIGIGGGGAMGGSTLLVPAPEGFEGSEVAHPRATAPSNTGTIGIGVSRGFRLGIAATLSRRAPTATCASTFETVAVAPVHRLARTSTASLVAFVGVVLAVHGCTRQDPPGGIGSAASAGSSTSAPVISAEPAPSASADDDDIADDAGVPDGSTDAGAADVPAGSEFEVKVGGEFKIAATSTNAWIYAGPNDETVKLGYLRMGAIVDRSEKPIAHTKRCKGGWYRVAPKGFVCAGKRATLDVNDPVVVASWKPPMRGEPLPYRYGRSKEVAPHLYYRVPTRKEQERAETIRWAEYMPNYPKERYLPVIGQVDEIPPFLLDGKALPKPYGATQRLRHPSGYEGKSSNHSSFAFQSVHEIEGRMFGLTTDLLLVPLDRVNVVKLTEIHGGPIPDLPAGIILGGATKFLPDEHGNPKKIGEYQRFDTVGLTGATRGDMWETADGHWLSSSSMKLIRKRDEKRDEWPSFAKADPPKKWIDVSVKNQMLIAYEGTRAVYVTTVSTGIGDLGDPEKTLATKRGVFTIKAKHLTATMSSDESVDDYELSDVPYVQYFQEGYALHAAFWHEKFGRPWSHGCVNLTPRDAAWIFEWTDPQLPKDWHGIQGNGEGTIVYVHP